MLFCTVNFNFEIFIFRKLFITAAFGLIMVITVDLSMSLSHWGINIIRQDRFIRFGKTRKYFCEPGDSTLVKNDVFFLLILWSIVFGSGRWRCIN